jgi:hypothetical protein
MRILQRRAADKEDEMTPADKVTREIAIQAELIALNVALEGRGAEQASEALYALSRQIQCIDTNVDAAR